MLAGTLTMEFDDGAVTIGPGEFLVVPRGVAHKPVAPSLVEALLIEPVSTVNTGDAGGERTREATWL
jgi:mannose-6-phosphate isomerase-like protein (cupin superfamily)